MCKSFVIEEWIENKQNNSGGLNRFYFFASKMVAIQLTKIKQILRIA